MLTYAGIDPGATGALAIIKDTETILVDYNDDVSSIRSALLEHKPTLVVLEKVSAMPGQGVTSMFKFGTNYGRWQGILDSLQIPYILIHPKTWQKEILSGLNKGDKKRALNYCRRLFPQAELHLEKHIGRADALCLALYAKRHCVARGE